VSAITFEVLYCEGQREVEILGSWPQYTDISPQLLEQCDPAVMCREGDKITIDVDNAAATYRIIADDPSLPCVECELIQGAVSGV
jgi:hypothetical protein